MDAKTMNQFLNDFWQKLVKPTCEKAEQDYGELLNIATGLEEKYPEIDKVCAGMCIAYINGLEGK